MKNKLFLICITLFSQMSFAAPSDSKVSANERSRVVLMKQNPEYYDQNSDSNQPINILIAAAMVSNDDGLGNIILTQIFNNCEPLASLVPAVFSCELMFLNSDRKVNKNGDLLVSKDMLESSVTVKYLYHINDITGDELVSSLEVIFAG
jgi:hypothetical protein